MRRFRVAFGKGEAVRYISHLDLMRTWERTLRRAGIRLAHSQGFNPRPRLIFAAPLAVGITSDAEMVDVVVEDDIERDEFQSRLEAALPPGLALSEVTSVAENAAALMATILSSDYLASLAEPLPVGAVAAFLARQSVPYERRRKGGSKQADMRPGVLDLWQPAELQLGMRLRLDVEGLAVRPDEVLQALGVEAVRVHRTALAFKGQEVAHAAA